MGIPLWWLDILLFDFLIAGAIGIITGYFTCMYLERHTKKWFSRKSRRMNTFSRIFEIFHPTVWWNYDWKLFDSAIRFLQVGWLVFITQISDLNCFFMVNVLRVPENHWALIIRIISLAFLAMISVKEYYEFINST